MLSALEQRQSRELQAQVEMLAESPTLKAAIDTYQAEIRRSDAQHPRRADRDHRSAS